MVPADAAGGKSGCLVHDPQVADLFVVGELRRQLLHPALEMLRDLRV